MKALAIGGPKGQQWVQDMPCAWNLVMQDQRRPEHRSRITQSAFLDDGRFYLTGSIYRDGKRYRLAAPHAFVTLADAQKFAVGPDWYAFLSGAQSAVNPDNLQESGLEIDR